MSFWKVEKSELPNNPIFSHTYAQKGKHSAF